MSAEFTVEMRFHVPGIDLSELEEDDDWHVRYGLLHIKDPQTGEYRAYEPAIQADSRYKYPDSVSLLNVLSRADIQQGQRESAVWRPIDIAQQPLDVLLKELVCSEAFLGLFISDLIG